MYCTYNVYVFHTLVSNTGCGGVRLGILGDWFLSTGRAGLILMRLRLLRRNEWGLVGSTLGAGAGVSRWQVGAGSVVTAASALGVLTWVGIGIVFTKTSASWPKATSCLSLTQGYGVLVWCCWSALVRSPPASMTVLTKDVVVMAKRWGEPPPFAWRVRHESWWHIPCGSGSGWAHGRYTNH